MSSFFHDCPYCGSKSAAFLVVRDIQSQRNDSSWYAMALCGVCKEVALAELVDKDHRTGRAGPKSPIEFSKQGLLVSRYEVEAFEPKARKPRIASDIPENVEKPLSEAEHAYNSGLYSAAGSCYRKSIERALKAIDPTLSGMLNKRIRTLEEKGVIPRSMIELMDQVRLFGNSSMHDDDGDPTKEECSAAREFCHLFLTYAFSMPAMVKKAKDKLSGTD